MRTSGIETYQPPSIDAPVLAEIVRRLAEAYRPERIYLFGSTARGDAGLDSDLRPDDYCSRGCPGGGAP